MKTKLLVTSTLTLLLLASFSARAETGHNHAHSSHVHGQAKLQVLLEGETLLLNLFSPAANIVGFEHKVNNSQTSQTLAQVKAQLADANALFTFKPTSCEFTSHHADLSHLEPDLKHQEGHSNQQAEGQHKDIESQYEYRCKNPDKLKILSTSLMEFFPGIEALQVQWLVNNRQGAQTLDNNHQQINFR